MNNSFTIFHDNPKDSTIEVIKGIYQVGGRRKKGITKKLRFSGYFQCFFEQPIKSYVFKRMGKEILLDLALRILQEVVQNGPSRDRTLQLAVEHAASGGKTVTIAESEEPNSDEESPEEKEFGIHSRKTSTRPFSACETETRQTHPPT